MSKNFLISPRLLKIPPTFWKVKISRNNKTNVLPSSAIAQFYDLAEDTKSEWIFQMFVPVKVESLYGNRKRRDKALDSTTQFPSPKISAKPCTPLHAHT